MMKSLIFIIVASTLFHECLCYSAGAPVSQCESMTPNHGAGRQTDPSPYEVKVEKTYYKPGENVKLSIESSTDNILGFLIQARKEGENSAIGTFAGLPANTEYLPCSSISESAITHARKLAVKKLEFEWEPPLDLTGKISFFATVVRDRTTFWVKIESRELEKMEIQMMTEVSSSSISLASVMTSVPSSATSTVYAEVEKSTETIKPTSAIMVMPEITSVYVRVSKAIADVQPTPTVNNTAMKSIPFKAMTMKPTTSGNTFVPNIFITLLAVIFVIGQLI